MKIEKGNENTVSRSNHVHKVLIGSYKAACVVEYFKRKRHSDVRYGRTVVY